MSSTASRFNLLSLFASGGRLISRVFGGMVQPLFNPNASFGTAGREPPRLRSPIEDPANLHVIAVFFNFQRFKQPVANFNTFVDHMGDIGVTLHVVELVLGEAAFEVTDPDNPLHTQLRTDTEFFQKENLVNIGVANLTELYPDWRYMAWVDADIVFFNENIAYDTMYRLNRHPVVQMWTNAIDLGPTGIPLVPKEKFKQAIVTSFGAAYNSDRSQAVRTPAELATYSVYWHTGYAWAMRRDAFEAMGGLYENAILGASDHHMAWAWVGQPQNGIHGAASKGYRDDAAAWSAKAYGVVRGDVGVVPGMIHHHWHGRKEDRKYVERWAIMVDNGYDPALDLERRPDGLLRLTGRCPNLQFQIRDYFEQRNDDANTLS